MCADFNYYLNRQGAPGLQGEKGDKGDKGDSITISTGVNTPTEYTLIFDKGDGNSFETGNLKYPMRDDGGTYLRYDRTNNTVVLGYPNIAELNGNAGEVQLATTVTVGNNTVQNKDAVSYELFKSVKDSTDSEITSLDGRVTYLEQHGGGGGGSTPILAGAFLGKSSYPDGDTLYVRADHETLDANNFQELSVKYGEGLEQDDFAGYLKVKVDGTTIDFDSEGKLTAIGGGGGTPANMVTTNTAQTITGAKTFDDSLKVDVSNNTDTHEILLTGTGTYNNIPSIVMNNQGGHNITLRNNEGYPQLITSDNNRLEVLDGNLQNLGQMAYTSDIKDATITLTQGTTTLGSFSLNQSGNQSINIPASGGGGGSTYAAGDGIDISSNDVISAKVDGTTIGIDSSTKEIKLLSSIPTDTSDLTNGAGYITGITSGDVTSALGYTPYSSANPNGYTSNIGTVTSVNNTNPDSNGNVTLSIPDTTNMVTTNTTQTISGSKTFSTETHHQGVITFDSALGTPIIRGTSGSNYRNMITRSNTYSTVTTGNTSDNLILKGALTRPKYSHDSSDGGYLALYSDIPGDMTGAGSSTAGAKGLVPAPAAGDNTKFLRGDGTWQDVSGGGSVDAYTKAETDTLLKNKITGTATEYPLQWIEPIDNDATEYNITSSSFASSNYTYLYYNSSQDTVTLNTKNSQPLTQVPMIEIPFDSSKGLNITFKGEGGDFSEYTNYSLLVRLVTKSGNIETENLVFAPESSANNRGYVGGDNTKVFGVTQGSGHLGCLSIYKPVGGTTLYYAISKVNTSGEAIDGAKGSKEFSQSLCDAIDNSTHIQVYLNYNYSNYPSTTTFDKENFKLVYPDPNYTIVTDGDEVARYSTFSTGENVLISKAEVLQLKYDSNTLGINAQNQLTVINSGDSEPIGASRYFKNVIDVPTGWVNASLGLWIDSSSYPDFKDYLFGAISHVGEPFSNGYIRLSTGTYTDYDLVLNTSDYTFRLPLLNGTEDIVDSNSTSIDWKSYATTDGSADLPTFPYNGTVYYYGATNGTPNIVVLNNTTSKSVNCEFFNNTTGGTPCSLSGRKGDVINLYKLRYTTSECTFYKAHGDGNLYYKLSNSIINTYNQDISPILQSPRIVESYNNGLSWYRVWSNGFCEQGGFDTEGTTDYAEHTIILLKPYNNTNYTVVLTGESTSTSSTNIPMGMAGYKAKSNSSFTRTTSTTTYRYGVSWVTFGYIS